MNQHLISAPCPRIIAMPGTHTKLIVMLVALLFAGSAIGEDNNEKHRHSFARDIDALHTVLSPLWHAPPGKERSQNICAQAGKLESLTKEIHSGDTQTLLESIAALKAQCQANPADIDAVFSQVHDAFHHLAKPKKH